MAYDPQTRKDLKPLHAILADGAEALRKLLDLMEEKEIESVSLQIRELKKRLLLHVEPAVGQIRQVIKDIEAGESKGAEYAKKSKK